MSVTIAVMIPTLSVH